MSSGLWWGFWSDYPKTMVDGREYAQIGNRLYTRHAVERFAPSGRRSVGGVSTAPGEGGGYLGYPDARAIAPAWVEEAIEFGIEEWVIVNGEPRTVHRYGDLEVVTTSDDRIVITVGYRH
jgi:hypothetical protein